MPGCLGYTQRQFETHERHTMDVLATLSKKAGKSLGQIAEALGTNDKAKVKREIDKLIPLGKIRTEGNTRGRLYFRAG